MRHVIRPLVVALFLLFVALASVTLATDDEPDEDLVELKATLWNIDDEAVIYVDCEERARVGLTGRRTTRLSIEPDAVITVQVDNDRHGYAWGVNLEVEGETILRSEEGIADTLGAHRADFTREFEMVFNRSLRADGTPTASPSCLRV
jgi:hypothetical protein